MHRHGGATVIAEGGEKRCGGDDEIWRAIGEQVVPVKVRHEVSASEGDRGGGTKANLAQVRPAIGEVPRQDGVAEIQRVGARQAAFI